MLEVREITKIYQHPYNAKINTPVLRGVSFTINSNQINFLVGPSGSGKTTLINILRGMISYNAGDILFDGVSVSSMTSSKKYRVFSSIGYVNQTPKYNLDFNLTLLENLYFNLSFTKKKLSKTEKKEKIKILLQELNIDRLVNKNLKDISGGELQRCSIATALIKNPKILLLDEPTSQLDSSNVNKVINLINKYTKKNSIVTLLATHDNSILENGIILELKKGLIT